MWPESEHSRDLWPLCRSCLRNKSAQLPVIKAVLTRKHIKEINSQISLYCSPGVGNVGKVVRFNQDSLVKFPPNQLKLKSLKGIVWQFGKTVQKWECYQHSRKWVSTFPKLSNSSPKSKIYATKIYVSVNHEPLELCDDTWSQFH